MQMVPDYDKFQKRKSLATIGSQKYMSTAGRHHTSPAITIPFNTKKPPSDLAKRAV
jgi:hypothetical protein